VVNRLSRIYQNIFIDEVQDLAWWDLELIKLFSMSSSKILLVWDPRQVTYLTNHSTKYKKYKGWRIPFFLSEVCDWLFSISDDILWASHRNNRDICDYSSKLFPEYTKTVPCVCAYCRQDICQYCDSDISEHEWIKRISKDDAEEYIRQYTPQILRRELAKHPELNYWASKWKSFCRVLIYPTDVIESWINWKIKDIPFTTRCKFYVAITRARHSVAIVGNWNTARQLSLF